MPAPTHDVEVQPELLARLGQGRDRTDELFGLVKAEALYDRPIAERHRIVFYIGHLEAFDCNLLHGRVLGLESFDPSLDRLFAFGIDPVGGGLPSDQPSDWPAIAAVWNYVTQTRQTIDAGLSKVGAADWAAENNGADFSLRTLLHVAIEHRLMHAETLAYMLHRLSLERKHRPARWPELVLPPGKPEMVEIAAGPATLGLDRADQDSFGWDNEYEAHGVRVPAFAIDKYMVPNGQYLDFIEAEGYQNPAWWTEDDWEWKAKQAIEHPAFWVKAQDRWLLRTMFDEIVLPLDWPVYVSQAEASAFARWAGKSLPTEAQWHRAAYGTPHGVERPYPWGSDGPSAKYGNFDFGSWDPAPVQAFPGGESAFGVSGMLGNGWEWTSTLFAPFTGFRQFSFYPGYSADFFDGKHYVMKGGSMRTAACMLRRSFRNWFQPHYPYVYAGFRCVST